MCHGFAAVVWTPRLLVSLNGARLLRAADVRCRFPIVVTVSCGARATRLAAVRAVAARAAPRQAMPRRMYMTFPHWAAAPYSLPRAVSGNSPSAIASAAA